PLLRNEEILDAEIMAAGAAQAADMPGIEDFNVAGRKQHQPHVGSAVGAAAWRVVFGDDAAADGPAAVLDEAAEIPVAADPIAAGHRNGFAGRIDGAGDD